MFYNQINHGVLFFLLGPYKINRVPLRRVDQAYVIATQTKVDVSAMKLPDNLNDDYFKRKSEDTKGKAASIFQEGEAVSGLLVNAQYNGPAAMNTKVFVCRKHYLDQLDMKVL